MSYILDALKRSEEERQQEKTFSQFHDLHPAPINYIREKSKNFPWISIAVIVVLICLSAIYFAKLRQPTTPLVYKSSKVTIRPLAIQSHFSEENVKRANTQAQTSEASPSKKVLPPKNSVIAKTERQPEPGAAEEKPVKQQQKTLTEIIEPAPLYTGGKKPAPIPQPNFDTSKYDSIPFLEELTPSFQEKVPVLKLAGHVYSIDPKLRLILINNTILREKDIVGKDLILEEIIPNGIIIRSGETRFRLLTN